MADYYEIDFRQVHTSKSGDAICIRYQIGQYWYVHLVDGGYSTTAPEIADFIRGTYRTAQIDNMVVTHPDRDHAEGLAPILEEFDVRALWLLRPWAYAAELLPYFHRYQSLDALVKRLRDEYPFIYELEKIAIRRNIPMFEPFQGAKIGAFTVLAPSRARYGQLVIQSDKTPQIAGVGILTGLMQAAAPLIRFVKAGWGSERFSNEPTSVENEMSVVQYAVLCGDKIVLTGDAGRDGMTEAAGYAQNVGLMLPGVNKFQVPHHGGRRNLSTDVLNWWVGKPLQRQAAAGQELFTAMISAAKEDPNHPRKAVVRALLHRGAFVLDNLDRAAIVQKNSVRTFTTVQNVPYPDEQEED
jgi:hypothetical protein